MKPSLSHFIIFSLLFALPLPLHAETLEENCKKISGPNLPYEFCVAALKPEPGSKIADLFQLGVIAFKLTVNNATFMKSSIEKLLKDAEAKGDNGALKSCLQDCLDDYSNGIDTAGEALSGFERKRHKESNLAISAVFDTPDNCEEIFKEMNVQSMLTKLNENFKQLAAIPLHINGLMEEFDWTEGHR